jgi:hypothetical protein
MKVFFKGDAMKNDAVNQATVATMTLGPHQSKMAYQEMLGSQYATMLISGEEMPEGVPEKAPTPELLNNNLNTLPYLRKYMENIKTSEQGANQNVGLAAPFEAMEAVGPKTPDSMQTTEPVRAPGMGTQQTGAKPGMLAL